MDEAIDTLKFLREYLNNEVHPNCEYYIYSSLVDITDKALVELTAYKVKLDGLREYYREQINNINKIGDLDIIDVMKRTIYRDMLNKLEEEGKTQ